MFRVSIVGKSGRPRSFTQTDARQDSRHSTTWTALELCGICRRESDTSLVWIYELNDMIWEVSIQ